MATIDTIENRPSAGNAATSQGISCDQAQSLLRLFSRSDLEGRGLGAQLISAPNGSELYVTPRFQGGAYIY